MNTITRPSVLLQANVNLRVLYYKLNSLLGIYSRVLTSYINADTRGNLAGQAIWHYITCNYIHTHRLPVTCQGLHTPANITQQVLCSV